MDRGNMESGNRLLENQRWLPALLRGDHVSAPQSDGAAQLHQRVRSDDPRANAERAVEMEKVAESLCQFHE